MVGSKLQKLVTTGSTWHAIIGAELGYLIPRTILIRRINTKYSIIIRKQLIGSIRTIETITRVNLTIKTESTSVIGWLSPKVNSTKLKDTRLRGAQETTG